MICLTYPGRILSRLSKDQDILDTELTSIMSQVSELEQRMIPTLIPRVVLV